MTKMRKSRKGFTLTELAIVIAVIAILIAVLVPTFVSLINKAKESSDSQLVKNINTAVAIEDATGNVQTAGDAINVALNNGYSVSNLTPMSDGNVIVYDQISKRFALISEETLSGGSDAPIYADSSTTKTNFTTYTTFVFVKTSDSIVSGDATGYTITGTNSYILSGDDWNGATVTAPYGIDDSLVSVDTVKAGTADVTPESTASASHAAAKAKIAEDAAKTTYPLIYNIHAVNFEYNGSGVDVISYGTPSYVKVTASSDSDKITINGTCISVIIQSENKGNIEINASITYLCNDSSVSVSVNSSTSYKDVSSNDTSEDLYAETKISVDSNGEVTPGTRTNLVTGEVVGYIGNANDWTYSGTTLKSYTGSDVTVTIPVGTTEIGSSAFKDKTFTGVSIPDSVTSIDGNAFYNCTGLTDIVIPDTVTALAVGAFDSCTALKNATIGGGVSKLLQTFNGCTSLTTVIIKNGVTSISDYAFQECSSLVYIEIPESVTEIGQNAFFECTSLSKAKLPDSLQKIGNAAFYNTQIITTEDDGSKYVGNYLINGVDTESFTVKEGTTLIADYAFSAYNTKTYFTNIQSVTIPDSVKYIGLSAFNSCSNLTSVDLGNGVISIGDTAFSGCSLLSSITIPASITTIGLSAFFNCSALAMVTFAENSNLNTIGSKAFMNCKALTEIVIPESTNKITIDQAVFRNCSKLSKATISSSVISVGGNTFTSCNSELEIYFTSAGTWQIGTTKNPETITIEANISYSTTTLTAGNTWTKN